MKRIRPAALACALALCSCFGSPAGEVTRTTDLDISWKVDDQQSAAKCTEFGLATWRIEGKIKAPSYTIPIKPADFACGTSWTTGEDFHNIDAGEVELTLSALDAAENVLAVKTESKAIPAGQDKPHTVEFAFTAEDFSGTATGTVIVSWKITGTVDGTETGASWDTCAEVGANTASVSVDGTATKYPCADNDQSVTLTGLQPREYQIDVALLKEGDIALTTSVSRTITPSPTPVEAAFLFSVDRFNTTAGITGSYRYTQLFESTLKCGETDPAAGQQQIALLEGTTKLDKQSCPAAGSPPACTPTDESARGPCFDGEHVIADVPWGVYKITLKATPAGSTTACWEAQDDADSNEIEIIVGVGTENPVQQFVLERINSAGDCAAGQ